MNEQKTVYEIAILGRVTWNLHSLNNEGNIGNVVEPRTLKLADGTTTDGISGEMLKHIHSSRIWELEADKSRFCPVCRTLEPMRADGNKAVTSHKKGEEEAAITQALTDCVLCDLHGFLVQRPTVHRQSTIEFGWAVGLRGQVYRDIHQHARHAVGFKGEGKTATEPAKSQPELLPEDEAASEVDPGEQAEPIATETERTTSQMLFSRPTRSGVYAFVTVFQPWRISLNTVNYKYPGGVDRHARYKLALRAYEAMFLRTDGAMTSTRLPHLENLEGTLLISRVNFPVPVISPLKEGYQDELRKLVAASDARFELKTFSDLSSFVSELHGLQDDVPYALEMPE
jgi:CRISPR-associated protein Cst2